MRNRRFVAVLAAFAGVMLLVMAGPFLFNSGAEAATFKFDMNNPGSPTQTGYTGVLPTDLYTVAKGYGWVAAPSSRDRGAITGNPLSNLLRDFHNNTATADGYFNVDVPNGTSQVTLTFHDSGYLHDNIQVYAEGVLKLADVDVPVNTTVTQTFTVAVADGQLNLRFKENGGTDGSWIINGIDLVPLPSSILLIGAGLLGLLALGTRKAKK